MVRLDLDATLLGEQPAFNTIGVIKGTEKPDEYVMLSAHFDSWDGSSGATDNGTGTLMAMEAMRILKLAYPNPKRTIMVGHWASEEQGLNGSTRLHRGSSRSHEGPSGAVQPGQRHRAACSRCRRPASRHRSPPQVVVREASGVLHRQHERRTSCRGASTTSPPGNPGGTDGAVFACFGTPSFGMGAVSWNYGTYTWHTNRDTYDKVVFDDLKHNATLAAMMAYRVGGSGVHQAGQFAGQWPANWPANCGKAPRVTRPRY